MVKIKHLEYQAAQPPSGFSDGSPFMWLTTVNTESNYERNYGIPLRNHIVKTGSKVDTSLDAAIATFYDFFLDGKAVLIDETIISFKEPTRFTITAADDPREISCY